MRRRALLASLALLLAAGSCKGGCGPSKAVSLAPPEQPPPVEVAAAPASGTAPAPEQLGITVSDCPRAGCELTLAFSMPMVAADALASGPKLATIDPPQDGSWAWRSPTELVFTPAPGAFNWGNPFTVTVAEATPLERPDLALGVPWRWSFTVGYFGAAGKVAYWPVVAGDPRLVGILNRFTGQIGSGPLFLLYDQPVDVAKVRRRLAVADANRKALHAKVFRPRDVEQVLSEPLDPAHLVAVRVLDLPESGSSIELRAPERPNAAAGGTSAHPLVVATRLALESIQLVSPEGGVVPNGQPVPLDLALVLAFSNPFELGLFTRSLVVEPAPLAMTTTGGWKTASVRLGLAPGTRYTARLAPGFRDVLGNEPASQVRFGFVSRDLAPVLLAPALPTAVEHDRARLPVKVRNVDRLAAGAVRFQSATSFAQAMARGPQPTCAGYGATGTPAKLDVRPATAALNVEATMEVPLAVKPGLLCVQLGAKGRGSEANGALRQAALVQSTTLGITAKVFRDTVLAWVTGLADGAPQRGARLTLLDAQGARVSQATTDASGTAILPATRLATPVGVGKPLFVVAEKDGGVAVSHLRNEHLSKAWQFGLEGAVAEAAPLDAAVFTDRGAYRPGETVHVKVVAGKGAGAAAAVTVTDARGQQVVRKELKLDAFAAADLDVGLREAAAVGVYSVDVTVAGQRAQRSFRVEEYRVPTFRVAVAGGDWRRGADAAATISAAYLHGGSLDGRAVRWEVTRSPEPLAPAGLPGFVFGVPESATPPGAVAGREERLDGQGNLTIRFRPDHPSSAGPMRYTVEAAVTDVDRQAYSGRFSRVIHPAAFYVGLRPPARAVLNAGEVLEVPVVAVTPDGKTLAGAEVRARLERVDHHVAARLGSGAEGPSSGVQLLNRPVAVERSECLVTTEATPVTCKLALAEAGQYRVRVWARDVEHQVVQAGFGFTVSGGNPTAWPRFDQDRIEIVTDRASYAPGDLARLVVQTPFESAVGLLTIERDGVIDSRVFEIRRDTPAVEVRIRPEYAPNVFASVMLVRGRVHDERDATGFETGAPAFKIGYAKLTVDPRAQRLSVAVEPSRRVASPGEKIAVAVAVRDDQGKPAPGQATVWVVDEAVLALTGYRTPDPVAQIHAQRPLGVRTGESRLELPHAKRSRLEQIFPSGDGAGAEGARAMSADLLRSLFQSTAYWNPKVAVGADGKARVEITLPDNTTTYRVMAVAADAEGRAGSAEQRIVARRPLMVQAVTPRFVHPGDELPVEALVFNGTGADGEAEVTAELVGLAPQGALAPRRVAIPDGKTGAARFPVKVTGGKGAARIRFAVRLGAHRDAVEAKLPILEPGVKRTIVASKTVSGTDTVSIVLPADRVPGSVKAEVVASTTALTELKDAVQYLMDYPNGCIEQTTSTAYPLVMLKDLLPEIGVEVDQADLRKFTEAGIRRILSFQTSAGGLAYWPGSDEPHAFATAFGLTALIEGKKRGFDVPDPALRRMADFLEATLRRGDVTESIPHGGIADGDTRALFVMTLGRLGRPQPAYLSTLWDGREKLTAFGLSFLGIAAAEMPGGSALTSPILAAVRQKATEEIEEAWYSDTPKGGYSFDSPLRTHASALLAYAGGAPASDLTGKLLTGLLKRRQGGLWGNTQENVFGIMGIHALVGGAGGGTSPAMTLEVNGQRYDPDAMQKPSRRVRRLTLDEGALHVPPGKEGVATAKLTNTGGKPIIVTLRAELDVQLDEKNRAPTRNGFTVARTYETLDGASLDGKPVPLGSLVRVRLKVRSEGKLNYVAIDDRLPAGLEPLNTALATTEKVSQGAPSEVVRRSLALVSYSEIRDHRVAFYVDDMPAGEYEYGYVARAATPGRFLRPAARAEAMYRPDVSGSTAIDEVVVR